MPAPDPRHERDVDEAFPFGVASGDPSPDSVIIWTTTPRSIEGTEAPSAIWELAHDRDFTSIAASGQVDSTDDGSTARDLPASTRVTGLDPDTTYHYRFRVGGDVSRVGTTRTLPRPSDHIDRVRIGLACCARLPTRSLDAYRHLAEHNLDVVVHLGDYLYEDGERPHRPPHMCVTDDDYRTRYEQYRSEPALQHLHAAAPWVSVWDDHEVADDSWEHGSPDDATDDHSAQWRDRLSAAAGAYLDWMPQEPSTTGPTKMDRRLRFGDLADLIVLDARLAGRSEPARRSGGPALVGPDEDRSILGDEQWDWLADCVSCAPNWLVVCTQTQVSPLRLARLPDPHRRLRISPLVNPGQWDGYPVEQRRLGALLAPVADRTLLCSGDLHGRFLTELTTPDGASIPEMTTPSIASTPFAEAIRRKIPMPRAILNRWLAWLNPHISHMDLEQHGSTVLDITRDHIAMIALNADGIESGRWELRAGERGVVVPG